MLIFNNEQDVCDYYWAKDRAQLAKALYKYSDAGVYIYFADNGIQLGTTVEGTDAEFNADFLAYPFTSDDLFIAMEYLDDVACTVAEAWDAKEFDFLELDH